MVNIIIVTNIYRKITNLYFIKGFYFKHNCRRNSLNKYAFIFSYKHTSYTKKSPTQQTPNDVTNENVNILMVNLITRITLLIADFILASFKRRQFLSLGNGFVDANYVLIKF